MNIAKPFVAGYVATLLFHQGLWAAMHAAGKVPNAAWDLSATVPLGIPSVLSLSFWGGIWGIAIWMLIKQDRGPSYWFKTITYGAVGPSAVALLLVFPMKGLEIAGGWDPKIITGALMLNAAWGYGLGLIMRLIPSK